MAGLVFGGGKKQGSEPADARDGASRQEGGAMDLTKDKHWTVSPSAQNELNALLGRGSEFDGKLSFEGTVRIDGNFSGEITTTDTLIVGEGARVTAEISCGTIVVHGEINGNIRATTAVELHKPARVKGDVTAPSLMVERGVVFDGRSKMEDAGSNVIPITASSGSDAD